MSVAIVTGSSGLVGAEAVRFFAKKGLDVVGIDNDMRQVFFGPEGSTAWARQSLERDIAGYVHHDVDIRDGEAVGRIFARYGRSVSAVVHAAAQPSHDWAARDPLADFTVNANGTLSLLEAVRWNCPDAAFVFCSTNKVYGDTPNRLPIIERERRWELAEDHPYALHGIDESMSIDGSMHSLFGVSKTAADLLVQEYGRYFGLKTGTFRAGCLTGPGHSGVELHGFLAYLAKCAVAGQPYIVFGYKGKQVRDNIHSRDLLNAFWAFIERPRVGAVYNIGGGRFSNCSVREAIALCEELTGRPMNWSISEEPRRGDHVWWISDCRRFMADYPEWRCQYDLQTTLSEICAAISDRRGGRRAAAE